MDDTVTSGRLSHYPVNFGLATEAAPEERPAPAPRLTRRPVLALTAEGPRRPELIAWAGTHRATLARMRLLAPAGVGVLLAEQCGLRTEPLTSGTLGPAATAGLAAARDLDAMIAFTDPIEPHPGDTTTRSLTRLAVFWDIPIAGNRATADLLLATVTAANALPAPDAAPTAGDAPDSVGDQPDGGGAEGEPEPIRGSVRLWTVRATVDDVPGRLAVLAASLARRAINILSVQVHLTADGPVDELLVAASPMLSAADLTAAVINGGGRVPRVALADAHALVDAPTRALALATRLVRSPEDLAPVLTSLLPGAQVVWRAESPEGHADSSTELWLTDPTGGGYLLSRPMPPFTPAECARAYAMIDVATVALAHQGVAGGGAGVPVSATDGTDEFRRLLLGDGREVVLRRATPDDELGVAELAVRCSATSRLRRYVADLRGSGEPTLAGLLAPEAGYSLVVESDAGRVVALANLRCQGYGRGAASSEPHGPRERSERQGSQPEMALLVEDGWRGQRIGTALARRLVTAAQGSGISTLRTVVPVGSTPMVRIMTGLGQRLHREYDGGLLTLIVSL